MPHVPLSALIIGRHCTKRHRIGGTEPWPMCPSSFEKSITMFTLDDNDKYPRILISVEIDDVFFWDTIQLTSGSPAAPLGSKRNQAC
jgi:hypothetical protein